MSERRIIGFDREIRSEWLDAVASRAVAGDSSEIARRWLDGYLADLLGGKGHGGNRGKTITVLMRIWFGRATERASVREEALNLLPTGGVEDRLALHWMMTSLAYPFFGEVATIVGRLLSLQGEVDRGIVLQRLVEAWGDRPAVSRGGRAVWTSMTRWGVLQPGGTRGRYTVRPRICPRAPVAQLVLRTFLATQDCSAPQATKPRTMLMLFPFDLGR